MTRARTVHGGAFIGDDVTLGDDVRVGPGAVLLGPLVVGDRVWIGPNVVIGTPPEISSLEQNAGWTGEIAHRGVIIGSDVVIRELSTIHQGSLGPTVIGRGSWLLNSTYVAHDCSVGEEVTLSAGVRLGGHVIVGDRANLGMNALVHQRRRIGAGAMVGMGTPVTRDAPPFSKVYGSPARVRGVNEHVLRKIGAAEATIARLADDYAGGNLETRDLLAEDEATAPLLARWLVQQSGAAA